MKVFLFFAVLNKALAAPIERHMSERKARILREAKEAELADWMKRLKLPSDCVSTKSSIRELECRNLMQLHTQAFEHAWSAKLNNGWKP